MTLQRALVGTPYTQHTAGDGRTYWAHKETRASSWTMPEEVAANMKRIQALRSQQPPSKY